MEWKDPGEIQPEEFEGWRAGLAQLYGKLADSGCQLSPADSLDPGASSGHYAASSRLRIRADSGGEIMCSRRTFTMIQAHAQWYFKTLIFSKQD